MLDVLLNDLVGGGGVTCWLALASELDWGVRQGEDIKQNTINYSKTIHDAGAAVCLWCRSGHQPGVVANPARGRLNWENGIFSVPVRA